MPEELRVMGAMMDKPDAQTDKSGQNEHSSSPAEVAGTENDAKHLGAFDVCGNTEVKENAPSEGNEMASVDSRFTSCLSTGQPAADDSLPDVPYRPTVSVSSDIYDLGHRELGHALIINQETFSPQLIRQGYSRRVGTAVDERNIHRRLKHLGFRVTSYPDLTGNQIKNVCAKMAAMDHSQSDMFVCVILSHGEEGIVFGTDKPVLIKDLADLFKADCCPTLAGKPKLFIIQACRGYQTDPGVKVQVVPGIGQNEADAKGKKEEQTVKLPIEADFLFAYSTVPGFYSWRNGANGSWFIQALSEALEKMDGSIEIRKLLTVVNRKVAQNFQSNNPDNKDFHQMKQIPCITSMLTKDLFLFKKKLPRQVLPPCVASTS